MRRFELVEGSSSKFWEVEMAGCDVTVRFGRLGTNGQSKTKSFASVAAAQKEHDALVKEKTGKGYGEVGVAEGAKLAAVSAPAPAAAPVSPKPAAALAPTAAMAVAVVPAVTPSVIDWPQGGFDWSDELRKSLPVVRGIHAPPLADGKILLSTLIVFDDDAHSYYAPQLRELAAAAGRPWTYWGVQGSTASIQPDNLARADHEFWLELCAQAAVSPVRSGGSSPRAYGGYGQYGLQWVTDVGIGLHGLTFMVQVALDLARLAEPVHAAANAVRHSQLPVLRKAIAASDDAAHDAVIAVLGDQAGATPLDRRLRAYLCPHRSDWALASIADNADASFMLKDCVMPAETALAYLKGLTPYFYYVEGTMALQIHLHGSAAFELMAQFLRKASDRDNSEKFTSLVSRMRVPQLVPLMAELIERKEVRAALDKLSQTYPAAVLKTVAEQALASGSRLAEGWAVRLALREPAALAQVLPALGAADRGRFEGLLSALQADEAPAEQLPELLREPPWLRKARASELPTLDVAVRPTVDRIDWAPAAKARHAAYQVQWASRQSDTEVFDSMQITAEGRARLLAGELLQPDDLKISERHFYGARPELALRFPDATGLALWNSYPTKHWYAWGDQIEPISAILARWGEAALPGLVPYVQSRVEEGLVIALPVDSGRLVPVALHALRNLKKAKAPAVAWLRAHAVTALTVALPLAFGKAKAERDDAQFGLRWFEANGFQAQAREAAAAYGDEMSKALQALIDADPLLVLPSRMPKLPSFFVAASFRRPALRDGGAALPVSAVEHIGSMLAISKLEAPYAGLALVKETCTPASLAEFAWDLFEAWNAAGAPSKESWAFVALGLLGDDETARRLAPRIREWPGESQHQRAVTGLDLLAAIGSDVALMHLNGIAGKVKFKALQDRAREKIAAVAEARGFTAAELADRLVPDLGLDEQGSLRLDFGPRQFFVGFDETLKPFVKDAQGVRLKDLPKPIKSDDAALADAATERYKQMKKDAKAIASLQVMRLEMSMIERRRWSAADFRLFFLEHPLMRHLAARVVWAVYDAQGRVVGGFRVAEDWTLADADDVQTTLADDAQVGIVHVLEMPAPMKAAFGQILADYEILQPFKQLGRETYTLTPEEHKSSEITRFADKTVATGSVMGLINRGWERGQAQDAGWVGWFSKTAGDGLEVQMELDPGTIVGDLSFEPKQRIPKIVLRRSGTWDATGHVGFASLDPIVASEVLRDADLLAPLKDA